LPGRPPPAWRTTSVHPSATSCPNPGPKTPYARSTSPGCQRRPGTIVPPPSNTETTPCSRLGMPRIPISDRPLHAAIEIDRVRGVIRSGQRPVVVVGPPVLAAPDPFVLRQLRSRRRDQLRTFDESDRRPRSIAAAGEE